MKKKFFSLCASICMVTLSAHAQYDTLHYFKGLDGSGPRCDLLLSGNVLYGTTTAGGVHGAGCVFSVKTDGTAYTDLYDFNGPSGSFSYGSLTLSGNELFGNTGYGGSAGFGTIFSVKTDGSRFLVLHNCVGNTTGTTPEGIMVLSGNTLYGVTTNGGASGYGNIFSMDTNGTGYTDLFDFSGTNGAYPAYGLTLSGGVLYGTAGYGGPGWTGPYTGNGVIFSINTNGSGYTVLLDFNGTDGTNPGGPLAISGNQLFGMAGLGGAHGDGIMYSIKTDGSSFKDLMDFNGADGSLSLGGLKISGYKLFGMTTTGGANDSGTIFSIDSNGHAYKKMLDFNGNANPTGKFPYNALTLSGSMLYGVTYTGGLKDYGVVFSFDTILQVSTSDTTISCNGGVGHATAYAAGGTSPYTYSWAPGGGTHAIASNLSAGVYTITVTDTYGNSATASVSISQPAALGISFNVTDVSCQGDNNGSLTAIPTGGTSPYTYLWSVGGTTATKNALSPGTYTIKVTDYNGCTATASSNITQPAALTVTHDSLPQHGPCNGLAAVTPSGGTSPYTYFWTTGGQTTDTINGQCAGTYCCVVSDKNGCSLSTCVTIKLSTGDDNITNSISAISISPNPNNGCFTIAGLARGQEVYLYDYLGQKLNGRFVTGPIVSFDISDKANGLYLIRIINTDGSLVTQKKMLKMQ